METRSERKRTRTALVETAREEERRVLLKLTVSQEAKDPLLLLEKANNSDGEENALETLLQLEESVYSRILGSLDDALALIERLWQRYQSSVTVCTVLVNILGKLLPLVTCLSHDQQNILTSFIAHPSNDVKALVLRCWVGVANNLSNEFVTQCLKETVEVVYSPSHTLRMECLNLIGQLSHRAPSHEALLLLVTEFCNDCDSRVRREALQALLQMTQKGVVMGVAIYNKACELLRDDDELVRCVAVKLVHVLGLTLKDSTVALPKDSSITLSIEDDAFIKTCGMVNDGSLQVKCLAASLLGKFSNVSTQFLMQTLDKKLMSHLQVVKSDHDRARELHQGGGTRGTWDTGQRWGAGIPRLNLDPSEITLMSSGSCGAFVHCTEDEYMEVRAAAITSMGELSRQCPEFGASSLDFLIDMINDEIQNIRLQAIKTLRNVSASINLREDQLETVLGVLQESSLEIREALHDLLAASQVTSRSGLNTVVQSLLDNLRNYPTDRLSIWNCLKRLGLTHAHLVSILAPELLSIHPFYMSKEPDINDPAYISILILVFNAASIISTLTPLFPSHVFRHYLCLRDSIPQLIPQINTLIEDPALPRQPTPSAPSELYLKRILSRALSYAQSHDATVTMTTLKQCSDDLNKLAGVESSLRGCGTFSSQLLHCQLLINKTRQILSHTVLTSNGASDISSIVLELTLLSYRLQWGYVNHTPSLVLLLSWLRCYAHCVLVQLVLRLDWPIEHSNKFAQLKESLLGRLEKLKKSWSDNQMSCLSSIQTLFDKDLVAMGTDQLSYLLQNVTMATSSIVSSLNIPDLLAIQQCTAIVDELDHTPKDTPLKFLSSLAFSLPMSATLENLDNVSSVALQVRFPDGRVLTFEPKPAAIRPLTVNTYKLTHDLVLSHGKWTDSLTIQISIIIHHSTDIATERQYISLLNKLIKKGEEGRVTNSDNSVGVVAISDKVKMKILPQDTLAKGFNVFGPT